MKRILVIQLLRIGDIIQTTPALSGLRARNPGSHITALVRKAFAEPLQNNRAADEVIAWDVDSILTKLFDSNVPLAKAYQHVQSFIDDLQQRKFDAVINLTNDLLSAIITYLLNAGEVVGLSCRSDGSLKINGNWIKYLFLTQKNNQYNCYNIVDILANSCCATQTGRSLSFPTTQADENFACNFLQQAGLSKEKLIIGFQPGASKSFKMWPAENFAELGDKLVKKHGAQIILFGSAGEIELERELQAHTKEPLASAIGKTALRQLAALLKKCDVLITNDTGTMHVAAAVGTQTLVLSFGSVCPNETAPYGNGHLVLAPEMDCFPCSSSTGPCNSLACRDLLRVDSVLRAFELALSFAYARNNTESGNECARGDTLKVEPRHLSCQTEKLAGLVLYRTVLDALPGRLTLLPVSQPHSISSTHPGKIAAEEILKEIYARFWEAMCNGDMLCPSIRPEIPLANEWGLHGNRHVFAIDNSTNPDLEADAERKLFLDEIRGYISDFKNLESFADNGIILLRQMLSVGALSQENKHQVSAIANTLLQLEQDLERAGNSVKFLTSNFVQETRFISKLPAMAVVASHLKAFQNLKFQAEFFISILDSIKS